MLVVEQVHPALWEYGTVITSSSESGTREKSWWELDAEIARDSCCGALVNGAWLLEVGHGRLLSLLLLLQAFISVQRHLWKKKLLLMRKFRMTGTASLELCFVDSTEDSCSALVCWLPRHALQSTINSVRSLQCHYE